MLAATILFIATNAGVIGASRITYAMASYRQLPEVFRRLHPRFKTPWLSLVFFAGIVLDPRRCCPGRVDFLGTMYSFGAMLSFTIAHASLDRAARAAAGRGAGLPRRPNLRVRGIDWPLFAIVGGARRPGSPGWSSSCRTPATRCAGLGWLARRLRGVHRLPPARRARAADGDGARAASSLGPALALEYRKISRAGRRRAASRTRRSTSPPPRGRARRADRRSCTWSRCRSSCRSTRRCPRPRRTANELLDEARAIGELVRRRRRRAHRARAAAPARAIVDEAERRETRDHRHGRAAAGVGRRARGLRRHRRLRAQARAVPRDGRGRRSAA